MAKAPKIKSREAKVEEIVNGIAEAAKKQNQREKKIARVTITAEFEVDSVDVIDIISTCRNATEELSAYGYVTSAKLSVPASEMDLT